MGLFLAMYGNSVKLSEALFISAFAMAVVFLVLLIISYLIDITAFFINAKPKNKAIVKTEAKTTEVNENVTTKKNDDTVVVIAAAIAAYLGTSVDNVKIKSIRRVNQTDSPWTERGLFAQINKK